MRRMFFVAAAVIAVACAAPAYADDYANSRDIQSAVDSYMATGGEDASLVGGTGSAGYDAGFWIRGGDFLLRINATIQARFEAWDWDDEDVAEDFYGNSPLGWAGDTSGFSLPRATLKFSGEAPCNICWYMELQFGHFGRNVADQFSEDGPLGGLTDNSEDEDFNLGTTPLYQSYNFDVLREAWIEWCYCPAFNFRMGQIGLPTTRQLMTAPELQQFVDISLASSWLGNWMPGYTFRNRDHGFMVHGALGCNNEWSYMVTVTNGDGADSIRNVLDHRTSDNLAYGARLNWAFLAPIGYEEGALRQATCQWYGEIGAWGFYYADRVDKPHQTVSDSTFWGLDLAMGWGGFSMTAAYSMMDIEPEFGDGITSNIYLIQLGYHFPGTAWEIAARVDGYDVDLDGEEASLMEYAFGVNYYLNGHANKLSLDVSFISSTDATFMWWDYGAGYNGLLTDEEQNATLIRFQWQLAL